MLKPELRLPTAGVVAYLLPNKSRKKKEGQWRISLDVLLHQLLVGLFSFFERSMPHAPVVVFPIIFTISAILLPATVRG